MCVVEFISCKSLMWLQFILVYDMRYRCNFVFFQIPNHLFHNNLLNSLFLSQWFEMLPLSYLNFHLYLGLFLDFLYCSSSLFAYSCIRNTSFWLYSLHSSFEYLIEQVYPCRFVLCVCVCIFLYHINFITNVYLT